MYAPIQFASQLDKYLKFPSARSREEFINNKYQLLVKSFFNEYGRSYLSRMYLNIDRGSFNDAIYEGKEVKTLLDSMKSDIVRKMGITPPSTVDLFDSLMFMKTVSEWKDYKTLYKVGTELAETLVEMETPELIGSFAFTKLPASVLYIEYPENFGFCDGNEGCFIYSDISDECAMFFLVNLVRVGSERVESIISRLLLDGNLNCIESSDENKVVISYERFDETIPVTFYNSRNELTKECSFRERDFLKFFTNFAVYLQACNRDVEVVERVSKNKVGTNVKMKDLSEVKVGFKLSSEISADRKKVYKYANGGNIELNSEDSEEAKRSLCSHYRSAHWHRYWVGSGDSKKLEVKWIKGIFIQGNRDKEAISVHPVK